MNNQINDRLLNASSQSNNIQVINEINNGANINAQNPNGITALMYASMYGNLDLVYTLVDLGVNLNIQNHNGETALISAIINRNRNIIVELIHAGTNVNIRDNTNLRAEDHYNNNIHYFDSINMPNPFRRIISQIPNNMFQNIINNINSNNNMIINPNQID